MISYPNASIFRRLTTSSIPRVASLATIGLLLAAATASAQSFRVEVDFGNPGGRQPEGALVEGSDGCLYGTTIQGGAANGMIYKSCGGFTTTVFIFTGPDGSYPEAGLIVGSDGALYGTTRFGGSANKGTVYRFAPGTAKLTTLHSFSGSNGAEPRAELLEGADGRLYGVTAAGGSSNYGTVFSLQTGGSGFTVLRSFAGSNGRSPLGRLVQASDGFLYGTTSGGGSSSAGTVFKISTTGSLTTLVSFNGTNGAVPNAGLFIAANGYFYGTSVGGGANSYGTVFRMSADGKLSVLHSFSGTDGYYPYAGVIQAADGLFYGASAYGGGSNGGVLFKMDAAGKLTVLKSLTSGDGTKPESSLLQASNGRLYGTTAASGPGGAAGTLYQLASGALSVIHAFNGTPARPQGSLVIGSDDKLYGTSSVGGSSNVGTIFRLTPGTSFEVLHEFSGLVDGENLYDGLSRAADGSFYGAAIKGGSANVGTLFKLSSKGAFSSLAALSHTDSTGYSPHAAPVSASDGNFYGVLSLGGSQGKGTIYKMSSTGSPGAVFSFNGSSTGGHPYGRLALRDGVLYGTTALGGAASQGTLYSYDPSAKSHKVLHSFSGPGGAVAYSGVIVGSDGRLYGMTYRGGASEYGTVFAYDVDARKLTTLHSFNLTNGAYPYATLLEGRDGRLYGSASYGGKSELGVVFAISKAGAGFTVLHHFNGANGAYPYAGLVQTAGGFLYGTAPNGGSTNNGVIYRVDPGQEPEPPVGEVTVTSPNGAINWGVGGARTIKWKHSLATGSLMRVELSRDGGSSWEVIASSVKNGASAGSTKWVVTAPTTTKALIRVTAHEGGATDTSDKPFTIAAPFVQVTAPNLSADLWSLGTTVTVKWKCNLGTRENVKIELSKDGGATYAVVLASSTKCDGQQAFTVSSSWLTTAAKVRITWLKDSRIVDVSDALFLIK